jgi:hypothetical protein
MVNASKDATDLIVAAIETGGLQMFPLLDAAELEILGDAKERLENPKQSRPDRCDLARFPRLSRDACL